MAAGASRPSTLSFTWSGMSELDELREENARLRREMADLKAALAAKPAVGRAALYSLVDALPLLVAVVEMSGQTGFLGKAFGRWLIAEDGPFLDRLAPDMRQALAPLLPAARDGAPQQLSATLTDRSGEMRDVALVLTPRRDEGGVINGVILVGQDNTEQRRAHEALAESEDRARLLIEGGRVGHFDTDLATGDAIWSASTFEMMGMRPSPDGKATFGAWRSRLHPADRERVAVEHAAAVAAGGPWQTSYRILRADTGEVRWLSIWGRIVPRDGKGARSVGMVVDVTDEKQAEARQRLLLNELNHRVKNSLAAVQSIARSTLRGAVGAEGATNLFMNRLMALSSAHDVLTRETWEGAGLREIVAGSVRAYQDATGGRFQMEGEDVRIGPKAAVALSLALHELATNAAKYGALSGDGGRVIVRWEARGPADKRRLELEWRETGGPPVVKPARSGFGSRLLRQGLKLELGASAEIDFAPDGLVCTIQAPLASPDLSDGEAIGSH
jgi:two-component sensor histidine kinase